MNVTFNIVDTISVPPTDTRVPTEKQLKAEWESLKRGKTANGGDKTVQEKSQKDTSSSSVSSAPTKSESKSTTAASSVVAPQKVRHEWYQSNDSVVVTLYVKGIPKESVETELKDDSVCSIYPFKWRSGRLTITL